MARKSAKNFPALTDINSDTCFDAARGLYWYCVDYHSGQFSDLYKIQCELTYSPGAEESGPDDEARPFYRSLIQGFITAPEVLEAIVRADSPAPYYTVIVPPVPTAYATEWHAPGATLSRGAFKTESEAIDWARARLLGTPYSIKRIE